jgi:hypothetical protein
VFEVNLLKEEKCYAYQYPSDHCASAVAHRGSTRLAPQPELGVLPEWPAGSDPADLDPPAAHGSPVRAEHSWRQELLSRYFL